MLETITNIQLDRYGENHIESGKVFLVYGLYQWWIGEIIRARECLEKALSIYRYVLGDNHSASRDIEDILDKMYVECNFSLMLLLV